MQRPTGPAPVAVGSDPDVTPCNLRLKGAVADKRAPIITTSSADNHERSVTSSADDVVGFRVSSILRDMSMIYRVYMPASEIKCCVLNRYYGATAAEGPYKMAL